MTASQRRRDQRFRWLAWTEPWRIVWAPDGRPVPTIAGGDAGGSEDVTVKTEIPPKTPQEISLLSKQTELLDIQLQEVRRQSALLTETFPAQKQLLQAQTEAALQQVELFKTAIPLLEPSPTEREIKRISEARTLALLRGEAPQLLPGQEEQLETIFGTARKRGTEEVQRFGEEIAGARGLRLTDTPIGQEVLREKGRLEEGLGAAKASATLNFGQAQQIFNENVRQFQENLRHNAFQNRLALIGRTPGPATPTFSSGGLPLATMQGINPMIGGMQAERLAGAERTQRTEYNPGFFDYFSTILSIYSGGGGRTGGSASGGGGGGAALAGWSGSSARLKKDIEPLDKDEYDRAMDRLRDTPITRWRYKWESGDRRKHIGPILEMSPEEIRLDDTQISLLDYSGLLHAGLKAVDRKVTHFQAALEETARAAHRNRKGLPIGGLALRFPIGGR